VHCHNLHGGYFDLRALPDLSRRVPTLVTLHDAWMLSGHCAHSIGCEKWKAGCGACPDLRLYPAIRRDATAENWDRKREIYSRCRLHVATPCQWLADRVKHSILAAAVADLRVIPNGVNLSIFHPADRATVREQLGLPGDAFVILLTAGSDYSVWKDRRTLNKAMTAIVERASGRQVMFVALEDPGGPAFSTAPNVHYAGYQSEAAALAKYFQAADVYVHAARADTFPTAVLEALACGTPVVATRVGGIPEQIVSTDVEGLKAGECAQNSTGVLVAPSDPLEIAEVVLALMTHQHVRVAMGERAARDARQRFDDTRLVDDHLRWYQDVREHRH
jgi:glycosyltransferase involved in cell wall biosynthesis